MIVTWHRNACHCTTCGDDDKPGATLDGDAARVTICFGCIAALVSARDACLAVDAGDELLCGACGGRWVSDHDQNGRCFRGTQTRARLPGVRKVTPL